MAGLKPSPNKANESWEVEVCGIPLIRMMSRMNWAPGVGFVGLGLLFVFVGVVVRHGFLFPRRSVNTDEDWVRWGLYRTQQGWAP
ncbi:MAG: hypothetical protein ABI142_03980 [Bryocella sp.]